MLYVTPPGSRNNDEAYDNLPAIDFSAEMQESVNQNATIFKVMLYIELYWQLLLNFTCFQHLILRLKKTTLIIEEKLMLKLFDFIKIHIKKEELISKDENDYETQRLLTEVSAAHAKR